MASTEAKPLIDEKVATAGTFATQTKGWKASAVAADIATMGTGTLLAGLFNVAVIFVVPKLISVEDYGYWRMFGLYAGYVGFLHFGFADGALLRWAGRPMKEFRREIGPALKYLFWQHVIVLVPLCAIAALLLPAPLRFVGIAVGVYALVFNATAVLQYALQGARIFRPVAIATIVTPMLFCLSLLLWASKWTSNSHEVIGLFVLTSCVPLVLMLVWTKPWSGAQGGSVVEVGWLAKECVKSGWPIVLANTGVMLIVCADRLAVSWSATIQDFAQYSLAASAMMVPMAAIQACSQVFFSHLAGVGSDGRRWIYGISSRALLMAWALVLPYYFALDVVVRHFLPRYIPSLQYARILLLGIPFWAAIQILQMSYSYLNGNQKRFLATTVVVLTVAIGLASFIAFGSGAFRVVAEVQVAVLAGWWLFNEWALRDLTGQVSADCVKFLVIYVITGTIYWLFTGWEGRTLAPALLYYACVAVGFAAIFRSELSLWTRLVFRGNVQA